MLGDFVVFTRRYDRFEYNPNEQQTIQYLFKLHSVIRKNPFFLNANTYLLQEEAINGE